MKSGLEAIAGLKVMVIDDSNTIRRSAEIFLKQAKCEVILAEDGFDGTFVILGGSAGTFQQTSPGQFVAVVPEMAPFSALTTEQVQSLLGGTK